MFTYTCLACFTLYWLSWNTVRADNLVNLNTQLKPNNPSSIFSLGGTYDSMSRHPTGIKSCLNAAANPENLTIMNRQASLDFTQTQSLEMIQHALGVELSAQFGYGAFDISTSYNYVQSSQNDSYSINLNYIYQYAGNAGFKGDILVQGNAALTTVALAALSSPREFRRMCGDGVILQLDAGASILIRLSLNFDSAVEKNYYNDSFTQISGLQNILALIQSNPNNVHFNLSAAGIQVGGNPQLLKQLFTQNGGLIGENGYPVLNCGSEKSVHSGCVNLINQVINYSQTISQQLTVPSDFYLINPTITYWAEIGVNAKPVIDDPEIIQAMGQLTKQYHQDYQDLKFIDNYKNMLASKGLLSDEMQQNLARLHKNYQHLMDLYTDPSGKLMDCFNGFVGKSCLTIRDEMINKRNSILGDIALSQFLIYLKTNQYLVTLVISPGLDTYAQCALAPISLSNRHLYLLNCNGQVSGTLDRSTAISLIPLADRSAIAISDFNYNYTSSAEINSRFTYQFNQLLQADSFYSKVYGGLASITNQNRAIAIMQNVIFTNID